MWLSINHIVSSFCPPPPPPLYRLTPVLLLPHSTPYSFHFFPPPPAPTLTPLPHILPTPLTSLPLLPHPTHLVSYGSCFTMDQVSSAMPQLHCSREREGRTTSSNTKMKPRCTKSWKEEKEYSTNHISMKKAIPGITQRHPLVSLSEAGK